MASTRIYIMCPAVPGMAWHVSESGKEGTSYRDGSQAIQAARERARVLESWGDEVRILQEGVNGTWQVRRE